MKKSRAEQDLYDYEQVFWALSHATRRHVLVVLNSRGGQAPAGDIAQRFSCSWPTTSRHLKVLEEAGLVETQKIGREVFYALNKQRLAKVNEWFKWFL